MEEKMKDAIQKTKTKETAKSESGQENADAGKNESTDPSKDMKIILEQLDTSARIPEIMQSKYRELLTAKAELQLKEKSYQEICEILKSRSRVDSRLGIPPKILDSDERKFRKSQKKSISKDRYLLREKVDMLQADFNAHWQRENEAMHFDILRVKADSKKFVRENKSFLISKATSLINLAISKQRESILSLRQLATQNDDESIRLFTNNLRELLFSIDEDGAILCSGTAIKNRLYYAIRIALSQWNIEEAFIPDIILPVEDDSNEQ